MKRVTAVVTMILLLGSASLAAAECAWVLWQQKFDGMTEMGQWSLSGTFKQEEVCGRARAKAVTNMGTFAREHGDFDIKVNPVTGSVSYSSGSKQHQIRYVYQFYCVPDTIDPRKK